MTRLPALIVCLCVAAAPAVAQGRPLTLSGQRPLVFGTVLPGVPRTILRTDPAYSGEFEVNGQRLTGVQFLFALPPVMVGPVGATMPLSFGPGDAGYSASGAIGSQVAFDPRLPFIGTLPDNGRASVFLGGTANPAPAQRAGSYSGTVTLTVAYVGL